jgi:hypothetical protein
MRAISHYKHTKLKNTKIYSKGALVDHTKISTNENFPLYGNNTIMMMDVQYSIQYKHTGLTTKGFLQLYIATLFKTFSAL